MAGIARVALASALLTASCQAFLVFTPEGGDAAAPMDGSSEDAPMNLDAGAGADAPRDRDAADGWPPLDCDAAICLDFEQGPSLDTYGFPEVSGEAAIEDCANSGSQCLKWIQPGWMATRPIALGPTSRIGWELWIECQLDGLEPAYAYAAFVGLDYTWVVVACVTEDGGSSIQVVAHDSDGGGVIDYADVGPSPTRLRFDVDLSYQKAKVSSSTTAETTLQLPKDTPLSLSTMALTLGNNTTPAPRFNVFVDDIVIRRLQ